ncbi:MAG: response regulator [Bacteroidota bacterium]
MKLPFIIIVDDDQQVLRAIHRDIRNQYRNNYRVSASDSANEALELVKELRLKNETIALFISDQRMPDMEGIDFLGKQKRSIPMQNPFCLPLTPILKRLSGPLIQ